MLLESPFQRGRLYADRASFQLYDESMTSICIEYYTNASRNKKSDEIMFDTEFTRAMRKMLFRSTLIRPMRKVSRILEGLILSD